MRSTKTDPIKERPLHDYVPLYFEARNPMFCRVCRDWPGRDNLVVLCLDCRLLWNRGVIFTDGNAASDATKFFSDLADLQELDWACLEAGRWTTFPDGKRKRCAEVLVPDRVPLSLVSRAVVRNEALQVAITGLAWPTPVLVRPGWFF